MPDSMTSQRYEAISLVDVWEGKHKRVPSEEGLDLFGFLGFGFGPFAGTVESSFTSLARAFWRDEAFGLSGAARVRRAFVD